MPLHIVPACRQAPEEVFAGGAFNVHAQAAVPFPAGSVQRGLRVQMKVDRVHDHLYVALWLHEAAHHAKRPDRRAIARQKARNNGVVRALARCDAVGVIGAERKIMPAIVQPDAGAGHHHAAAKTHVIALNERHHVTLGVRCAQVHGAARWWRAGKRPACAVTDVFAPLVGIGV